VSVVSDPVLLGFTEYEAPARRLAMEARLGYEVVEVHRFPDGESQVTVPEALPSEVVVCRSLHDPNDKLIELLLVAAAARSAGAETLTLVAPYLCYMRQDKAFHPGEAISQQVIGRLLARTFDAVLTVDPHLHRVRSLAEAVPTRHAVSLHATGPIAHFVAGRMEKAFLLGPDAESEQWVRAIAEVHGLPYAVGGKRRLGDRSVEFTAPDCDVRGWNVVLVDDIASTGCTLEAAARAVTERGARSVSTVVTHGMFLDDAEERLRQGGVAHIWSTDSVPHPTNAIHLAPVLAEALDGVLSGGGDS
jgi:ribose-phosphate pyrophosphokinase